MDRSDSEAVGGRAVAGSGHGERPRVLVVVTRLGSGGVTSQVLDHTAGLKARGFDVRLVWGASERNESGQQPPPDLPNTHVPWLGRDLHPLDDVRAAAAIDGIVRRWRPDVVHTHLSKAGALARPIARRARVPALVQTFHGPVARADRSALRNAAYGRVERRLAISTDALVAVAPRVRDELVGQGIGPATRWHVVAPGIDVSRLASGSGPAQGERARLGLPHRGRVVGVGGHLSAGSDLGLVLRVAERVVLERDDVTFAVIGTGAARDVLERGAGALGGSRIRFLDAVDDYPAFLRACDLVAVTPSSEAVPVVAIEAAAAARPVIATQAGSIASVVRDGETGFLAPVGDDIAMARLVIALLGDRVRGHEMGLAAAAWVEGRFSHHRQADEIADLYGELLGRARRGRTVAGAGARR